MAVLRRESGRSRGGGAHVVGPTGGGFAGARGATRVALWLLLFPPQPSPAGGGGGRTVASQGWAGRGRRAREGGKRPSGLRCVQARGNGPGKCLEILQSSGGDGEHDRPVDGVVGV